MIFLDGVLAYLSRLKAQNVVKVTGLTRAPEALHARENVMTSPESLASSTIHEAYYSSVQKADGYKPASMCRLAGE